MSVGPTFAQTVATGESGGSRHGGPPTPNRRFDVDFSLAMHNRTGKYFIGRDLLECEHELIGDVYYWLLRARTPPSGMFCKIVCKLQGSQVRINAAKLPMQWRAGAAAAPPLLHLEPYTVLSRKLRRQDAVVCHDVGPLTHPELFDPKLYRAYQRIFDDIARVGPHLIFVSRASQIEFERLFPQASPASMRVIYPAIRADVAAITPQLVEQLAGTFLLTVGSIGTRKNQLRSIRAFERSGLAARDVKYVLCGGHEPGWEAVAAAAAATAGVVILPYVSDGELAWLYGNACGFVLASLLEGFGIPLAEAIAYGLVPAVSKDSVLEEVAGGGAFLVDPLSEDSIAGAMIGLVELEPADRAARLTLLRETITRFSLEKFCADWHLALRAML